MVSELNQRADSLAKGIDVDQARHNDLGSEMDRAEEAQPPAADVECIFQVYSAIAQLATARQVTDEATLRSLRKGASQALEAARVSAEIGANQALIVSSATRAWMAHAVPAEASTWRVAMNGFADNVETAGPNFELSDLPGAVSAAAMAIADHSTPTAEALRIFSGALAEVNSDEFSLGANWNAAIARLKDGATDEVFLTVVEGIGSLLERREVDHSTI
ncbi:hypothetical protein [Psychromicrobium lacuslunae]|uniref:Uncharacterized protein n=1 Tax=Psychromicrobium lacuslunae TaxID=1618207 RepID=A0A0D4C0K1_9MICC|nr:hypothetical protein [Psychromicrobium lacuslunae]AJT42103.1 hypothetical protein UM93_12380 [Psychromicrobium lacuslunae]